MIAWSTCPESCGIPALRYRPEKAILPTSSRDSRPELLDRPESVRNDLPENLRDIRRLNRLTGGTALAAKSILPLLHRPDSSLLDVATGSGDIPLAVRARAVRHGISVHPTGLDRSGEVLCEARRVGGELLTLVEGDARKLPFDDAAFDVVSLCLALHHFDPEDAVVVLQEMWRVASRGLVVVDLRRGALALLGAWFLTRTVARNRLTQHDGPLSVRRAYTPSEVLALALDAGIPDPVVTARGPARLTLIARKARHGR